MPPDCSASKIETAWLYGSRAAAMERISRQTLPGKGKAPVLRGFSHWAKVPGAGLEPAQPLRAKGF